MKIHKNKWCYTYNPVNSPYFHQALRGRTISNIVNLLGIFIITKLAFLSTFVCAQGVDQLFAPGAQPEILAKDFSFTEGPAVDRKGNVYFTDQPNNRIWIWTIEQELKLFTEQSGRSNGLYFDQKDRLLACADMDNELWRFSGGPTPEVLISKFEESALNGPNDLWVRPDGGIYFTDPFYKRNYWTREPEMKQPGQYVYYFNPEKKQSPIPVEKEMVRPNGLIGHPGKKILYVADIGDKKTYSYKIKKNGKLKSRKLFAEMGSDGMTIDERGNIYLTGKGVTIFNPDGQQIGHIPIPEPWTANICFGGKDMNTLFITASKGLYALKMNVKGIRSF